MKSQASAPDPQNRLRPVTSKPRGVHPADMSSETRTSKPLHFPAATRLASSGFQSLDTNPFDKILPE